jgi:hypothetical protein
LCKEKIHIHIHTLTHILISQLHSNATTDTFELYSPNDELIPTTKDNIAWQSDLDRLYGDYPDDTGILFLSSILFSPLLLSFFSLPSTYQKKKKN